MRNLLCVHCGHSFSMAGAKQKKSLQFFLLLMVVLFGIFMAVIGVQMLRLGIAPHGADRAESLWRGIQGLAIGIGIIAVAGYYLNAAPYFCPSCHDPRGFADDSVQASNYRKMTAVAPDPAQPADRENPPSSE
jgi:hypothetical protein